VTFVEEQLIPYLRTRIDLTEVLLYRIRVEEDQFSGFFVDHRNPGPILVVHSQELANILARRLQHARLALGALQRASAQLDRVLDHLTAETKTDRSQDGGSLNESR
jgi:hypothetical protein